MELPSSMTNKMDENVTSPFGGGFTMFGVDFSSKGLSWAENVYQKWENICRDHIVVKEPSKIVDAVGEQFRKIYEEVADDWLNPFSVGHVEVLTSDLSLEQDVIADVCEKPQTSHGEGPINEGLLVSPTSELSISLEETAIASLPDVQDEREEACDITALSPDIRQDKREEACDILNKKTALTPAESNRCSCSSETGDSQEEVSNSLTSASRSVSLQSVAVFPSEYPGDMVEGGLVVSCFTDPTKDEETSQGAQRNEYSVSLDRGIETNEEFEDVNLEDCLEERKQEDFWEESEKYELALISYRALKNRSYKKKLRDAFVSRFYSIKKNNEFEASFPSDVDVDPPKRGIVAASPVLSQVLEDGSLLTSESCEYDWELV
uniref:Protein FAM59A n=1 Tax=Anthurium amnicola TaxID=1678845 RepID=A0A1D1XPK0_9ARAE